MSGRVTKGKVKPRKAPEGKFNSNDPADNRLVLLWLCISNISGNQVNFEAVGAALDITTVAARLRFRRLKEKMDSMMVAFERSKESKPESASKPAQPAKQGDETEGPTNNPEELAEDI